MNLETYIERIDAYHEGALTETERLAFESDLESDADLLAAYDLYRQGNEAIEWQIGESLREQMQGWAQEDQRSAAPPKTGKVVAFRQIRWAAAAAVVLLLGLWFVFDQGGSPDNAELFASYYQAPDASGLRGQNASDNPLMTGLKLLEEGKGDDARAYFEQLLAGAPDNAEYQYYLGHAAMLQKDWAAAEKAFTSVETAATTVLAHKAAWNKALTLLAANRMPELKTQLESIRKDGDHGFYTQAGELLEELER